MAKSSREQLIERNTKHGMSKFPEYQNWKEMLKRCFNENNKRYRDYAERGISVHPDFKTDFSKFYAEIGAKPDTDQRWTVGRIDNNGWYTYGNIRWETDKQQAKNHTKQRNNTSGVTGVKYVTNQVNGKVYSSWVAQWNSSENVKKTKNFSADKFGFEAAKQMAVEYRNARIAELKSQGAEYAESHGSDK